MLNYFIIILSGYRKTADEVVEILNERIQPESVLEYREKLTQKRYARFKMVGKLFFFLFVVPVFIYAARKRAMKNKELIKEMMKLEKLEIERETEELRGRLVFPGEEKRKS
jgi:hypothetical protein